MRDRGSLYAVPMDDHKAAMLALRDAARVRELWHFHGLARSMTERSQIADLTRFYEEQIIATANELIRRSEAA